MICPLKTFGLLRWTFILGVGNSWKSWNVSTFLDKNVRVNLAQIKNLFILLERYQNIDIKSELAFSIWSCELKVMGNKRFESQINSLTIDH